MTYLGFLTAFVVIPILLLSIWLLIDRRAKKSRSRISQNFRLGYSFMILVSLALAYTTPWDNYLVATNVWWYDAPSVIGVKIGWVPLEEYLFFILQPMLGGLLLILFLSRKSAKGERKPLKSGVRANLILFAILTWLGGIALLFSKIPGATYLGLELAWAMPVIILQLIFGIDLLWKHWRSLLAVVMGFTIYLSAADAYAIQSNIWTINPQQSFGLLLGGVLPVEELVFFLLTNIMVAFGFVLLWLPESHVRLAEIRRTMKSWGRFLRFER